MGRGRRHCGMPGTGRARHRRHRGAHPGTALDPSLSELRANGRGRDLASALSHRAVRRCQELQRPDFGLSRHLQLVGRGERAELEALASQPGARPRRSRLRAALGAAHARLRRCWTTLFVTVHGGFVLARGAAPWTIRGLGCIVVTATGCSAWAPTTRWTGKYSTASLACAACADRDRRLMRGGVRRADGLDAPGPAPVPTYNGAAFIRRTPTASPPRRGRTPRSSPGTTGRRTRRSTWCVNAEQRSCGGRRTRRQPRMAAQPQHPAWPARTGS